MLDLLELQAIAHFASNASFYRARKATFHRADIATPCQLCQGTIQQGEWFAMLIVEDLRSKGTIRTHDCPVHAPGAEETCDAQILVLRYKAAVATE